MTILINVGTEKRPRGHATRREPAVEAPPLKAVLIWLSIEGMAAGSNLELFGASWGTLGPARAALQVLLAHPGSLENAVFVSTRSLAF